jgi:hypothetical protein
MRFMLLNSVYTVYAASTTDINKLKLNGLRREMDWAFVDMLYFSLF